ncbi:MULTISPECIES: DUF4013 domain-containing protein [Haloferax]|uniref:DUF4013 domain-containing protein n=1 Tax=Haloferax marinum TaxID=2666143 RepID=A0A6A8G4U0_9EURY|nr:MULTISPECIES: DUF4013 domain-containing protein [Haloferax]KAB1197092.1 DUF4013 domain-containing protein [Haloferax sp. CBA1150]MRW96121.1 DUF4013 domain-containing protein [Haloferax marinum]
MDSSDFEAAFSLPFARDSSLDTVVVGSLVTLASFTTPLAGVLLAGYVVRLVRAGFGGASALPLFDDLADMAVEGARLSAVFVVLQLPALALVTLVLGSSSASLTVAAAVSDPQILQYLDVSVFDVLGLALAGIAALGGAYLTAAATVALASERSFAASIPLIRGLASDTSFVSVVSASALVVFGGRLLGFFVGTSPVAGVVFTACVSFLTLVAAATLLGRGMRQSEVDTWTDQQPAFAGVESA